MHSRLGSFLLLTVLVWAALSNVVLSRPNVVLIIGDDQAWSDFGFMGHPIIKTPYLDRLAAESYVYRFGYVPTSLCRPSLATMLTGRFPHQHGITGNDPIRAPGEEPTSPAYLRRNEQLIRRVEDLPTLPRLLATAGYVSFQAGKWWEGNYSRGGFTHGMTHGDPERGGRHGDEGLEIGRNGFQPLLDFLAQVNERPFFIWYAPFLPHTPHNPPERILDDYLEQSRPLELSRYYAMCQWFDETVGQLLEHLGSRGFIRNTLVLYVTDNGWIQRTDQTPLPSGWKFSFAPGSKRSAKDGGIRTPILLHWPGRIDPEYSDIPVSSIDLLPTVLAAVRFDSPPELPGVSLLDSEAVANRKTIFGDIFTHDVVDPDDPIASLKYRWCVRFPWKLIVPHAPRLLDAEVELYDLSTDPHETSNQALRHPDLVAALASEIQNWWRVE